MLTETVSGSWGVCPPPDLELPARFAQHPRPELHDQAGLLGQWDEVLRQEPAELGVLPPEQRLHAVDPAALQVDDRLVEQGQLVALDRGPQRGIEVEPLPDVGVHPRFDRVAARPLAAPLGGETWPYPRSEAGRPPPVLGGG